MVAAPRDAAPRDAAPRDAAPSDALLDAARAGSPAAFGDLWRALSPAVAGYVRGRGVRDPEDVTSEVFLAALQRLPQFIGDGAAFRRWLFTIAHHRAVDQIRAQARRDEIPYEPDLDTRRADDVAGEVLTRLEGQQALALLRTLPGDQRDVLLLRLVADLPVADVAVVLRRSPEAVRQLQVRALARVRRQLAAQSAVPQQSVTPPTARSIAQT